MPPVRPPPCPAGIGESHPVGGDDRHVKRVGDVGQQAIVAILVAQQMALQLDIYAVAPEDADERIDQSADAIFFEPEQVAARQRDEPGRVTVELLEREHALPLRRPHFHPRHQPAQIPVAFGGFDENRKSN